MSKIGRRETLFENRKAGIITFQAGVVDQFSRNAAENGSANILQKRSIDCAWDMERRGLEATTSMRASGTFDREYVETFWAARGIPRLRIKKQNSRPRMMRTHTVTGL